MKEESKKSTQMDSINDTVNELMDEIIKLYTHYISLASRIGIIESDLKIYRERLEKNTNYFRDKFDDMESDITLLFHLMHGGDNFCGNCKHCFPCPDGLYRCDITECEIDTDNSSCIRFEHPQIPESDVESDAEICKACSDKDTPRCYKCSHFPF